MNRLAQKLTDGDIPIYRNAAEAEELGEALAHVILEDKLIREPFEKECSRINGEKPKCLPVDSIVDLIRKYAKQ